MIFELPLEFCINNKQNEKCEEVFELDTQLLYDLEMSFDFSQNPYSILFQDTTNNDSTLTTKPLSWNKYYTTNTVLLKTIYKLIHEQSISLNDNKTKEKTESNITDKRVQGIIELWNDFNDGGKLSMFCSKYGFFGDWEKTTFLNQYPIVLQLLSMYNLFSPALQLILPLIILIIPFFLIKFILRLPITIAVYKKILYQQLQRHSLGKIFTIFDPSVTMQARTTSIVVLIVYGISIYQNILSCLKFYNNMNFICRFLNSLREIVQYSIQKHEQYIQSIETVIKPDAISLDDIILKEHIERNTMDNSGNNADISFNNIENEYYNQKRRTIKFMSAFLSNIKEKHTSLIKFYSSLERNTYEKICSKNFFEVGKNMKMLYNLYTNDNLKQNMEYIIDFRKFNSNCISFFNHVERNTINPCRFVLSTRKQKKDLDTIKIQNMYYPFLLLEEQNISNKSSIVETNYNTTSREKAIFITGPNASGKTTYIKSVLINIIFSQQIAMGFYKQANILPQHKFYCYLSIPDTSGRDSLFQAEARRCLEIIHNVERNKEQNHFAIFDEIFSGTNSVDAVNTAYKYLNYMANYNFTSLVTTHFTSLVKKLTSKTNKKKYLLFKSYKMDVETKNNNNNIDFIYKYTISKGINTILGANKVLSDLKFPKELLHI